MRPLAYQCYMHNLKPYEHKNEVDTSPNLNELSLEELKDVKSKYEWSPSSRNLMFSWTQHDDICMKVITNKYEDAYLGIELLNEQGERLKQHAATAQIAFLYHVGSIQLSDILLRCKLASPEDNTISKSLESKFFDASSTLSGFYLIVFFFVKFITSTSWIVCPSLWPWNRSITMRIWLLAWRILPR